MSELTIMLDFVIIFLLITAIIYGFVLNRRIKLIRDSGRELTYLFRSFDDTILRAETGIEDLKKASGQVSDSLQKKIDRALLLIDELELLGERVSLAAEKAGVAVSDFKKIESKLRFVEKNDNTSPQQNKLPLGPQKNMVPEKPAGGAHLRKKALEDLLEEVSGDIQNKKTLKIPAKVNTDNKLAPKPLASVDGKQLDKKQSAIVSALKAMGFGD